MKHLFFIICSIIVLVGCSTSSPQEPSISFDPKVQQYIKEQNQYIRLTDKQKAVTSIDSHYDEMLSYMEKNKLNKYNYFLLDGAFTISRDGKYLMIPIRHYTSLKLEMKKGIDMKPFHEKLGVANCGNLSGKDGYLLIHIRRNKVEGFELWD
ncbi:MAG: hypothetical protein V4604_18115 [Bacteroidota bacterium]